MRKNDFNKIIEVNDEKDMDNLKIGDYFLYGKSMISQKQNKKKDQPISYYEVLDKSKGRVEYTPIFDMLEDGEEN